MSVGKTKSIPGGRCARTSLRWDNKVSTKLGGHCIMGSLLPSLKREMAMMSIPYIYIYVCVLFIDLNLYVCAYSYFSSYSCLLMLFTCLFTGPAG